MYLGRKLLLLFVLLISLGVIFQVSSYSYASISSPVTITVSSSENSLIAVKDVIGFDLKKVVTEVKTISDEGTKTKTIKELDADECSFFITNHLSKTIKVRVEIDRKSIEGNASIPITFSDEAMKGMFIAPGEKKEVILKIDEEIESGNFDITIFADWENGSAEIYKTINFSVETSKATVAKELR